VADIDAYRPLTAAITAISAENLPAALTELDTARACLPARRPHQSVTEIGKAQAAARAGQWRRAWIATYRAMVLLSLGFPPDPSTLPPPPGTDTDDRSCTGCPRRHPAAARFCPWCGRPTTT
jgi:hypothetical protein